MPKMKSVVCKLSINNIVFYKTITMKYFIHGTFLSLLLFRILKNNTRKSENSGNYFAGISPFNGKKAGSRQIALWSRSVDKFFGNSVWKLIILIFQFHRKNWKLKTWFDNCNQDFSRSLLNICNFYLSHKHQLRMWYYLIEIHLF